MMRAVGLTAYGVVCYTASMLSLIMLFAWLGGFGFFPIRLDDGIGSWTPGAVAWNTAIMLAFALYHSVFARTVVVVDTKKNNVAAIIPVGERVWGEALSPDGSKLYTANGTTNDVSVVDARGRKELTRIKVGDGPWGVAIVPKP